MISDRLLEDLACPVCLEPEGCPQCSLERREHSACVERYAERAGCACGGPDKVRLVRTPAGFSCPCCGVVYEAREGVVDLIPRTEMGEGTRYADHEFQERLEIADNPLLLSARTKANRMRSMLPLGSQDEVLDLGCGAGRFALYAGERAARVVGLDVAPFFLPRAVARVDLVLGDIRRLPFRKDHFPRAYCLDVLEHLEEAGVRDVLLEARRVLTPEGRLFVYTHAMESSWLARFQRAVNRLAWRLGERGLIDHERDRMRKSDHRNAIRSHEHFDALCRDAGLTVTRRRYYNVVLKALIEDLGLRLFEQLRRKRRRKRLPAAADPGPASPATQPGYGPVAVAIGRVLSWLLELDVWLFGRIRTGPFFAVLARQGGATRTDPRGHA
jgi:ubiquinone/menaquinone biosynthesis C-methylase UbiE